MPDRGSPSLRRQRLGRELRRLRERADMIGEDAATRLGWSAAKVSRIETAKTFPTLKDVEALLELYEADQVLRRELLDLRRSAAQKGWWDEYRSSLPEPTVELIDLESEAVELRNWEPQVVPGLLQTEAYARALFESWQPVIQIPPKWQRDRAAARMRRKQTLLLESNPVGFFAVFEDSVLTRQFGGPEVMREQLEHLIEISELPHVEMRILAQGTPPLMPTGPFLYLQFPDFPDVVYLEEYFGSRMVQDTEQVFAYARAFDHLLNLALDEPTSRELIKKTLSERWH
ncbi:transcriptional regulator [Sphaerisporangium siamense]|uniref:Transcriptional regulator with XRE-family HTH domain n=1 Tax=Sphaerisporangium siamense TaxID=795645 RepID=A0A7W7D528_9ACTN|nr:helix-turn-helix transcriptional regulator [Sphaerisporangium siamense]MBB4699036.1 transcriptional regulator with XRE-family HTH domain [Sphaerisporangium siamense]GII88435.1 transcriptional regulator [Sphaerisporangium siamense]